MRILITGSSGFIGSHVADLALTRGHEVVGLDNVAPRKRHGENFEFAFGSILTSVVDRYMVDVDAVLHLAGYSSMAGFDEDLKGHYETNLTGFLNVIDSSRKAGVRLFAYASSSAVCEDGRGGSGSYDFSESGVVDVNRLPSHYGKSKLMNEMIAESYRFAHGFRTYGLRYFNVYGKGDELKTGRCAPMQHFKNSAKAGEPIVIFGDGSQAKDFIHVSDAARMTMMILEEDPEPGVYNIGTGVATDFNKLAELVAPGYPVEHVPNPQRTYQYFTKADMSKFFSKFGPQQFVPLEEGIKDLA